MLATVVACVPMGKRSKGQAEPPIATGVTVTLDGDKVQTSKDGTMRIAGRGPEHPFRILVTTKVVRHPYPGEQLIAILTTGERVVKQAPFTFDARHARAKLDVPGPGNYRVEMWSGDRFFGGNTFVAASMPALDGQRALEVHQDAAPRLFMTRESSQLFSGGVRWMHWDALDSDEGFVAEWWHNGKRVGSAGEKRSELQRQTLLQLQITTQPELLSRLNNWKWTTEQFDLPDYLPTRHGHWELRIYRDEHAAVSFAFDVTPNGSVRGSQGRIIRDGSVELEVSAAPDSKDAMKQLAKLERTKFEASKKYLLGVTPAEVRALTRSAELRRMRIRLNELHRHTLADSSGAMSFTDDSPQAVEAKKLVVAMKKMIAVMGEPWTDSDTP